MNTTVPNTTDTAEDRVAAERAAYISGMRKLADILEAHPELELPFEGHRTEMIVVPVYGGDASKSAKRFSRLIPGRIDKEPSTSGDSMSLIGSIDGLKIRMLLNRDDVCERVVVGTREVTTSAPDPDAVAALPVVEQTVTEEIVEWRCLPILGGGDDA